jgi:hypothetical protein
VLADGWDVGVRCAHRQPTKTEINLWSIEEYSLPVGVIFFTVVLAERGSDLLVRHIDAL